MPKTSTMSIRIDPEIKIEADAILNYLGMTTSEAVTIFLRQVVINNGIPFLVKAPLYKKETLEAMQEAEDIANSNQSRFRTTEEMFKDLGV